MGPRSAEIPRLRCGFSASEVSARLGQARSLTTLANQQTGSTDRTTVDTNTADLMLDFPIFLRANSRRTPPTNDQRRLIIPIAHQTLGTLLVLGTSNSNPNCQSNRTPIQCRHYRPSKIPGDGRGESHISGVLLPTVSNLGAGLLTIIVHYFRCKRTPAFFQNKDQTRGRDCGVCTRRRLHNNAS